MPGILDSPVIRIMWIHIISNSHDTFATQKPYTIETHKNNLFRNEIYGSDKTRQMSPGNLRGDYFSNVPNKYGDNEK